VEKKGLSEEKKAEGERKLLIGQGRDYLATEKAKAQRVEWVRKHTMRLGVRYRTLKSKRWGEG